MTETKNLRRQSDHDLLIRLDENVTNMREDIKLMGDGLSTHVATLEGRVKLVEDWSNSFKVTWKLILGTATFIGGLVGAISTLVVNWLR